MKKLILLFTLLTLSLSSLMAQLKVGDNPTTINPSAVLEVESTSKGLLPPRMTQAQMNAIATPADGLMVYCTDCSPKGFYYYDASTPEWTSFGANNLPNATFASPTLNCGGALAGVYQQGTTMTTGNTKIISITVSTVGKYTATTNTLNGVTFNASGTLLSTGTGIQITLTATGTPAGTGLFTYTVSLAGQTSTFDVTFSSPATYNCTGTTATNLNPYTDVLTNGQNYTATVTVPYTAGNGSAYGSTTLTQSGLTLTRVAGTYLAGGGNIVYNLTGSYTGTTGAYAVTFTLPEGCRVQFNGQKYSVTANAGTDVYFDNFKVTMSPSGNGSMKIATTSGTMAVEYSTFGKWPAYGSLNNVSTTINTTYSYLNSAWSYLEFGDVQTTYLRNTANNRVYKISMLVGQFYLNNLYRIERFDTTGLSTASAAYGAAGTAVSLDNIKVRLSTGGNRQLEFATVSGTSTLAVGAMQYGAPQISTDMNYPPASFTTTFATPSNTLNLGAGHVEVLYIYDNTNSKVYKAEVITGTGFNNTIKLERVDVNLPCRQAKLAVRGTSVTVNNVIVNTTSSGILHTQLGSTTGTIPFIGSAFEIFPVNGYAASTNGTGTITTSIVLYAASASSNLVATGQEGESFMRDNNTNTWYRLVLVGNYNGGGAGVPSLISLEQL